MNKTKYHARFLNLFLMYLVVFIISLFIFLIIPGKPLFPPAPIHYIIIAIWVPLTIFYIIYAYKSNYYTLTKHALNHHKGRNTLIYNFKEIVYIDEAYSSKKGSIKFFTSKGDERYILHDKKREVYNIMLKRCNNTLSKEQFLQNYPKIKL